MWTENKDDKNNNNITLPELTSLLSSQSGQIKFMSLHNMAQLNPHLTHDILIKISFLHKIANPKYRRTDLTFNHPVSFFYCTILFYWCSFYLFYTNESFLSLLSSHILPWLSSTPLPIYSSSVTIQKRVSLPRAWTKHGASSRGRIEFFFLHKGWAR